MNTTHIELSIRLKKSCLTFIDNRHCIGAFLFTRHNILFQKIAILLSILAKVYANVQLSFGKGVAVTSRVFKSF